MFKSTVQRYGICGSAVIVMSTKSPAEVAEVAKPSLEAVFEAEEAPLVRLMSLADSLRRAGIEGAQP